MAPKKKNLQRVVLNLPPKTAATLEYLTSVAQLARTKSDLVIQMLNDYLETKRDVLNDTESWTKFNSLIDKKKTDKVDAILEKYSLDDDDDEDEEED